MKFADTLLEGRLIRRYKRFLADVELGDGCRVTAHTPNTGSMLGCAEPGARVWLLDTGDPRRKYPLSWELVESANATLVGINTLLANKLVAEAIETGVIRELQGYRTLRREVRYGSANSRIDLLLQQGKQPDCYVEIKNVTLLDAAGCALFPDAVTARGLRHLHELQNMVAAGQRATMMFCVQRGDARSVAPADAIDPAYGAALREAAACGVEVLAYQAIPTVEGITLQQGLPVRLD